MSQTGSGEFDVVIAGGGIVGASLACALGQRCPSLTVALIDNSPVDNRQRPWEQQDLQFDPRVSAITAASQRLFVELGVWQAMQERRVSPYTDMHVWDADGTGSIHFSAAEIHEAELGHIIENSVILDCLYARLATHGSVSLVAPATVSSLVTARRSTRQLLSVGIEPVHASEARNSEDQGITTCEEISTRLLVGADGPLSKVRHLAEFATREWDYRHHAIVTTVRTERPHQATAWQRFMDEGTLAFLPLSRTGAQQGSSLKRAQNIAQDSQHYCSIVWSVSPPRAAALMALDEAAFAEALQTAFEDRLGRVEWAGERFSFPLRQRHAINYVQQQIALVGDAAHTIHPLAGQGVNLGLLDAGALAEEIENAVQRRRDFASLRTLSHYQRRRKGANLSMMWLMEGFRHLFADQPLPVRWLRNTGLSGVDRAPLLKNLLVRQAMGL